ncbi:MAG: PRD domain-containing protein [Erysipelotrichaceae bacterium]|nr:PRD domain-containing protein [Erysipelotrichaceae bacterium]
MDFTERLEMFLEGEMITVDDVRNVNNILDMFKEKYGVTLTEENASTFVSHVCAAFYRYSAGEEIDPLPEEVVSEIASQPTYELSVEVFENIMKVIEKPFSEVERGYVLLHINNLIQLLKSEGEWN